MPTPTGAEGPPCWDLGQLKGRLFSLVQYQVLMTSPHHHLRLILGMQAGAVPTRMVPGHLIPGCVPRNPRRQTRTWKALRPQPRAPGSYTHRMWGALKRWHWFSTWLEESYPALWLPLNCLNHQPGYPNSYGMARWEQALWQGTVFSYSHTRISDCQQTNHRFQVT